MPGALCPVQKWHGHNGVGLGKVIKDLDHLTSRYKLRELEQFSLEKKKKSQENLMKVCQEKIKKM